MQHSMARGSCDGKSVRVRNFAVIAIVNYDKWNHHPVSQRLCLQPFERDTDTIDDSLFREWQDLIG